jgi:hypothetical protein
MYKDLISKAKNCSILDILFEYSIGLFRYHYTENFYYLNFNFDTSSIVTIPDLDKESIKFHPIFYLDDDNISLNVDEMLKLAIIDRFEYTKNNSRLKLISLLNHDIDSVLKFSINLPPFSKNNTNKVYSRIRIIKTYYIHKGDVIYYDPIGRAINNLPNSSTEIENFTNKFNDPIGADAPSKGVYCNLVNKKLYAVGLNNNNTSITTIFPPKGNLSERIRQHYTSNYLEPILPDKDFLLSKDLREKTNALTIFLPIEHDDYTVFENESSPIGKNTLICGEVIINKTLADKEFYVRRTFQTKDKNSVPIPIGSIVNKGDTLTYNLEGYPEIIYLLNYKDALVENIIILKDSYKIILKIKAPLGYGRIISDYGIKGVTHPKKDLGKLTFSINDNIVYEREVEMIAGPPSVKSGESGIKLAYINFLQSLEGESLSSDEEIIPGKLNTKDINLIADLRKGKWEYKGKTYEVYFGLMSFGVTDLALDCNSNKIRLMPETLKHMFNSNNPNLIRVAELLQKNYIPDNNRWILTELLRLRQSNVISENHLPIIEHNNPVLLEILSQNQIFFDTSNIENNIKNKFLLDHRNKGFFVKYNQFTMRFPSKKLIDELTFKNSSFTNYPIFYICANILLNSIRLYNEEKIDEKMLISKYHEYLASVDSEIFSKHAALSNAISPILPGGHLKQLVSTYVPSGVTVLLDDNLEYQVFKFRENYKKPIYELGCRNPVIWRFQLNPTKVWTKIQFTKFLKKKYNLNFEDVILFDYNRGAVIRNINDTLVDQSDTDGDLYPIVIPFNEEIQNYLQNIHISLTSYEQEWIDNYIKDELNKNVKFIQPEKVPFKYYKISKKQFGKIIASSAIAKQDIGTATTDMWKIYAALEYNMIVNNITTEQMHLFAFVSSRIVQDYVVRGIKHRNDGSNSYHIFSPSDIEYFEFEVIEILTKNFNLTLEDTMTYIGIVKSVRKNKSFSIISKLINGSSFIDTKYFSSIAFSWVKNTSFHKILSPFFNEIIKILPIEITGINESEVLDFVNLMSSKDH